MSAFIWIQTMYSAPTVSTRFFQWITQQYKLVISLGVVLILCFMTALPALHKDIRSDAFLSDDNPAIVYRDKVKSIFGLSDPIVIAIHSRDSIFTPERLNLVTALSDQLSRLNNIDEASVRSIATENNIRGSNEGFIVEPFYSGSIVDQQGADQVKAQLAQFPLYHGNLISHDHSTALVAFEYIDPSLAAETYQRLQGIVSDYEASSDLAFHLAGEGAITGFIGEYIDNDALRLYPVTGSIIFFIVFLAISRKSATFSTIILIIASVVISMGTMASMGIPYFVITNALPVILIGISVADSIHIYSDYFDRRKAHPDETIPDAVVNTLSRMIRPITLTSLTTISGFLALALAAEMPPFVYFGYFTALGVAVAWLYSLTVLPAMMVLMKTDAPKARGVSSRASAWNVKLMSRLGLISWHRSKTIVAVALVVSLMGIFSALQLKVDGSRIDTFHSSTAIYQANDLINAVFNGTSNIDIIIETDKTEGLFDPSVLKKIEQLQQFSETLPNVTDSVSIIDYLKQMNKSFNENDPAAYTLPNLREVIAQYFLLYSFSGGSNQLEQEIDYDCRLANIRLSLNNGNYQENKAVVESLQQYIDETFNQNGLTANLSGRVYLYYHWMKDLSHSHFLGLSLALIAVWLVSSLMFKSALAGIYIVIPVVCSVLAVYCAMVFLSIPLGIASSMFAAIAIGLGVDFSIHTLERFRLLYAKAQDLTASFQAFYPSVGRALLFNLLAVACGFGILVTSSVVPLNNFGLMVALSVVTCFFASMLLIPAMIKVFKPKFLVDATT